MSDTHSKETRSYNMSQIRSKNTKPELVIRKFLFSKGFRYRIHDKKLPGTPDIVLKKYNTAIFVNGCFWHGHENCRYYVIPKTRTEWWQNKINKNIIKDIVNHSKLKELGWNIIEIFECQIKKKVMDVTLNNLSSQIRNINDK
jgi:DNA mismatch endonuclease (patch repair protein)